MDYIRGDHGSVEDRGVTEMLGRRRRRGRQPTAASSRRIAEAIGRATGAGPSTGAEAVLGRAARRRGLQLCLTTGFSRATRDLLIDELGWARPRRPRARARRGVRGRPYPDLVLSRGAWPLGIEDVREVAVAGDTASDLPPATAPARASSPACSPAPTAASSSRPPPTPTSSTRSATSPPSSPTLTPEIATASHARRDWLSQFQVVEAQSATIRRALRPRGGGPRWGGCRRGRRRGRLAAPRAPGRPSRLWNWCGSSARS